MKYGRQLVMIGLAATFGSTISIADEPLHIHWAVNTAPPFHVVSGPLQGEGICDVLMDAVDARLPDITTQRSILPQTRIRQQFERDENRCFPCMIYRPHAARNAVFTEPTHFYYPHGIITTAARAAEIRERFGDPVSLTRLLREGDYRYGYPSGRVYGELQPVIDAVAPESYRIVHTGENATMAILAMIKAGRIDFTIDYQILRTFDQYFSGNQLAFIEIEETSGSHVLGAIGCTDNEWGRMVTERINQVLPEVRQDPEFLRVLNRWFEDKPEQAPYNELLKARVWEYPVSSHINDPH
ncbi:ABC transporter substrate-binding protein [Aliidiomarina halalkaliphila]|uniref:ABC transporter substrate-binding protein n=1 Tax=Aliidiomarina halalkaliphila TaxID=2593535 RepID=A0A552X059_9GAMM|nr:ABC transporter substrate-binding protein [Aliidiomarina halalkaliphila]TRW48442.1 ABC transporter substrate-binding protein [Aliidiomarina halalkaliphila]